MNREKYYEILINKNKYNDVYGIEKDVKDESDFFEKILNLFFSIGQISLEEIDNEIANTEEKVSILLLQELKYAKEYQLIAKKYSKVFTLLKHNLKGKLASEAAKIENNEDINKMVITGEELIESSGKPLYLGICLALILDRINRVNEAVGVIKRISSWYPENDEINQHMKKMLRDIYFRNRMYQQYKQVLFENQDDTLIYLFRNIQFFQFRFNFFVIVYVIVFFILWIMLGIKFIFLFVFLLVFNILNIFLSYKKNDLLLFLAYSIQTIYFVFFFAADAILYLVAK